MMEIVIGFSAIFLGALTILGVTYLAGKIWNCFFKPITENIIGDGIVVIFCILLVIGIVAISYIIGQDLMEIKI